ncbi:MAG: AAA family ATPase [Chloroflexota bacterium]|nr:AAA family ATPase [Chloroflexota bacterium]
MADNGARQETIPDTVPATAVYSYRELLTVDLPPDRPLIAGLVGEETGNIWGGPGGVGKSWLLMAAARAIASGTPFLGHFPTTQRAVLIVDEENRLRTLQTRARMFENAAPLGDIPITFAVGLGLRVDAEREAAQLDALMTKHRPGLTILDSLTRVHNANENNAGEMAGVFFNTKALMRAHRCAALFTDHTRKKGLNNDPAETLRGTSEKRAWPETIIDVAADEQERGRLVLTITKSRESEAVAPFGVRLDINNAAEIARLVYTGEATDHKTTSTADDIIRAIHLITGAQGPDAADAIRISDVLNCSRSTVDRQASRLVKAEILDAHPVPAGPNGGSPKKVYTVKGGRD